MNRFGENEQAERWGEPRAAKCSRCGAEDLEWYDTGVRKLLWDTAKNRKHECPRPSAKDEFGPK